MIHIGTSGFYYDHWEGPFYPPSIPKSEHLPFYAGKFSSLELNTTFYHLPKNSALLHWMASTPENFRFSLKAYRAITHYGHLREVHDEVIRFIHLIKPLKAKLGAILFQLPPSLHIDMPLLETFLSRLPHGYRYALEFRHSSWMDDAVFDLMRLHNTALCVSDFEKTESPMIATADFVYLRRHGPEGRYSGSYDHDSLLRLADSIRRFASEGKDVYCYFNNDAEAAACADAAALQALLDT